MTESLLVKATAPSATSKTKILELYNPTSTVELKYTGTLTFRWSFKWEVCVARQSNNLSQSLTGRLAMNLNGNGKSATSSASPTRRCSLPSPRSPLAA